MKISIKNINDVILNIFNNTKVLNVSNVYEKIDNSENLKLVIFLNNILYDDINILYTKFIFTVDKDKKYLINNNFLYLYNIDCNYRSVEFKDIEEFKNKIKQILNKNKFGDDIKILSNFIKNPAFILNDWFNKNNEKISVTNFKYEPKIYIMPCESLFFPFLITVNNNLEMELNIKKINKKYNLTIKFENNSDTIEEDNLKNIVEVICTMIKNIIK